jgi:hypothetical protein
MPRIEITTDAAWRNTARMTATEREAAEKTGFGLLAQQAIGAEMLAEMLAEGEAIWEEIARQADRTVAEIGGGR